MFLVNEDVAQLLASTQHWNLRDAQSVHHHLCDGETSDPHVCAKCSGMLRYDALNTQHAAQTPPASLLSAYFSCMTQLMDWGVRQAQLKDWGVRQGKAAGLARGRRQGKRIKDGKKQKINKNLFLLT